KPSRQGFSDADGGHKHCRHGGAQPDELPIHFGLGREAANTWSKARQDGEIFMPLCEMVREMRLRRGSPVPAQALYKASIRSPYRSRILCRRILRLGVISPFSIPNGSSANVNWRIFSITDSSALTRSIAARIALRKAGSACSAERSNFSSLALAHWNAQSASGTINATIYGRLSP